MEVDEPLNYDELLAKFRVTATNMHARGGYQYNIPVTFSTPPPKYSLRKTFQRALNEPDRYFKVIRQGKTYRGDVYIEIALFNKLDNSWIVNAGITETMIINNIRPFPDPPPAENAPAANAPAAGGKRRRTKKSKKSKRRRSFK
jgi:hypothetical protein